MERVVQPEILDELSPDDPRAMASRRDLQRLNRWMRHPGTMARQLRRWASGQGINTVVDLGGGDGTFLCEVARLSGIGDRSRPTTAYVVDRHPTLASSTAEHARAVGWALEAVESDIFDALDTMRPMGRIDVVMANLFLHHFDFDSLKRLFLQVSEQSRFFMACEPYRGYLPLVATKLLWALGYHPVTRHDGFLSVQAGFRDRELSLLWRDVAGTGWQLAERRMPPFSHVFMASKGLINRSEVPALYSFPLWRTRKEAYGKA